MLKVEVEKNLIGLEDMLFGVGEVTQNRGGSPVTVTKINAANLPFDETRSLLERIEEMDEQYEFMMENRDLMMAAIEVVTLLNALSVNIDDLAAWLVNGSGQLSAFHAYKQEVTEDEFLADGVNYTMLEDTIIGEDVVINMGVGTKLYVLKGEEFVP